MTESPCKGIRGQIRKALRASEKIPAEVSQHCGSCPECWGFLQCALLAAERPSSCPSGFTLASYIAGDSDGLDRIAVATHLALCQSCASAVSEAMELRDAFRAQAAAPAGFRLIEWGEALPFKAREIVRRWVNDLRHEGWHAIHVEPLPIQGEAARAEEPAPTPTPSLPLLDPSGARIPEVEIEVITPPAIGHDGELNAEFIVRGLRDLDRPKLWLYMEFEGRGVLRLGPGEIDDRCSDDDVYTLRFQIPQMADAALSIPLENIGVVLDG